MSFVPLLGWVSVALTSSLLLLEFDEPVDWSKFVGICVEKVSELKLN